MCLIDISDSCTTFDNTEQLWRNAICLLTMLTSSKNFSYPNSSFIYNLMKRVVPYYMRETSILDTWILLNFNFEPLGYDPRQGDIFYDSDNFPTISIKLNAEQLLCINGLSKNGVYSIHKDCDKYPTFSRTNAIRCLVELVNLKAFLFHNQLDKNTLDTYIDIAKFPRPTKNQKIWSIDDIKF